MRFNTDPTTYLDFSKIESKLADLSIPYFIKPGLAVSREISQAEEMLAEFVQARKQDSAVLLGCGSGALGVVIASQLSSGHIWLCDQTCIALDCTSKTLEANQIGNATIIDQPSLLPDKYEAIDLVIIILPKGRKIARRWLVEASHLLKAGGFLYLAGANAEGIQSVSKDAAAIFGSPAVVLGYRKGCRVISIQKKTKVEIPAWTQEPGIAPGTWHRFVIDIGWTKFDIYSLPGVFSFDHLDEGTSLLLDHLEVKPGERVLDVGCGYGIIGIVAAQKAGANGYVELIDANILAVASAQKTIANINSKNLASIRVRANDLMTGFENEQFSLVVSNPPFHTGKAVDYTIAQALIQQAKRVLIKNGRLLIVANRFIRYEQMMAEYFGEVRVLAQNNRYHILSATKFRNRPIQ